MIYIHFPDNKTEIILLFSHLKNVKTEIQVVTILICALHMTGQWRAGIYHLGRVYWGQGTLLSVLQIFIHFILIIAVTGRTRKWYEYMSSCVKIHEFYPQNRSASILWGPEFKSHFSSFFHMNLATHWISLSCCFFLCKMMVVKPISLLERSIRKTSAKTQC